MPAACDHDRRLLRRGLLTLGEVIGCDFAAYFYVQGWLARVKALKSWESVNAVLDGIAASHKGEAFATV